MFENWGDMVYKVPKDTNEKETTLPCSSKISVGVKIINGSELEKMFDVAERGI